MNSTVYGQAVTFTATVAGAAPLVGTPTGSVTFFDGATTLGSAPLSGGVASLAVTTLTVGSDSITAVYSGDPNFAGSPSTALSQTVDAGWHDHHGRFVGESLGLRPIGHLHGHGQPNGAGQWYADRDRHLHGWLDGAGLANTERRGGDLHHVEPVRLQPQGESGLRRRRQLHRQLVVSPDPDRHQGRHDHLGHVVGEPVGLRPIRHLHGHGLRRAPGSGTPTGTVTFKDGSSSLGTATLEQRKLQASPPPALRVATHSITVSYGGDANFTSSTSAALSQVVNQAGHDDLARFGDRSLGVWPGRDLHGDRLGRRARQRHADRQSHLLRRLDLARHGLAQLRVSELHRQGAADRLGCDHRGLQRRRQFHAQHFGGARPSP